MNEMARAVAGWLLAAALLAACAGSASSHEAVTYAYDANGRLIREDYGGQDWVDYAYDANANLTQVVASQYALTIVKEGSGSGRVYSVDGQIDCGPTCTGFYSAGVNVVLRAEPATNSVFAGWSGSGCEGTNDCVVRIQPGTNVTVRAVFKRLYTLKINLSGNGTGVVAKSDGSLVCSTSCQAQFVDGTEVTLTATPDPGYMFIKYYGWINTREPIASLVIDGNREVTAVFGTPHTIRVTKTGTGTGLVRGNWHHCGDTCERVVGYGETVWLQAEPAAGSVFRGWLGGPCTGTGQCDIEVSEDVTITAVFDAQHILRVTKDGAGDGTISSADGLILCGIDCQETYFQGTEVQLTATPVPGSAFRGWVGSGCSGTNDCVTRVMSAQTITAVFDWESYPFRVRIEGNGAGRVVSADGRIDCSIECEVLYVPGAPIALTAHPQEGSVFRGWFGGGCAGDGPCGLTINGPTEVIAQFDRQGVDLFVDGSKGDDANPGDSWDQAKRTIQGALLAADGLHANTIHVKEGTYRETVVLQQRVTLRGGYPAANHGRDLSGCESRIHPTIVDAASLDYALIIGYGTNNLNSLWGSGPNDLFTVGDAGRIFHFNGLWSAMASPTTRVLRGVWGASSNMVYAVGDSGTVLQYNGSAWSAMPSLTAENLYDVWGTGPTNVFAVGNNDMVLHYDGTAWSVWDITTGYGGNLRGVWGSSDTDIYVVGENLARYRYNGSSWGGMNISWWEPQSFTDVSGTGPEDVYAVGRFMNQAFIAQRGADGKFVPMAHPATGGWIRSVWCGQPGQPMVTTENGFVHQYDGAAWRSTQMGTNRLTCIWGLGPGQVYALESGRISPWIWNGETWRRQFGGENIAIEGITLTGAKKAPLYSHLPVRGFRFARNIVTGNKEGALMFRDTASDVQFEDNVFYGNEWSSGIIFRAPAASVSIQNNLLYEPGEDGANEGGFFWDSTARTVRVEGNTIHGGNFGGDVGIFFNGGVEEFVVESNSIYDLQYAGPAGISFSGNTARGEVNRNQVHSVGSGWGGILAGGAIDDVRIVGNRLHHIPYWGSGIVFDRAVNSATIADNELWEISGGGGGIVFWDPVTYSSVMRNRLEGLMGEEVGIVFDDLCQDTSVCDNELSNFRDDPADNTPLGWAGIQFWSAATRVEVARNRLSNFSSRTDEATLAGYDSGLGIITWHNVADMTVASNQLWRIEGFRGDGIGCLDYRDRGRALTNVVLRDNRLANVVSSPLRGGIFNELPGPNWQAVNNIVAGSSAGIHALAGSTGALISNNTLDANEIGLGDAGAANLFQNNIAANSSEAGFRIDSSASGTAILHNDLFGNTVDFLGPHTPSPDDANLFLDPQFVAPGAGDFHLQSGSPCVDAGRSTLAPEIDCEGQGRYDDPAAVDRGSGLVSYYDMGAHEYQEATGPARYRLTVIKSGDGAGVVWDASIAIHCGTQCSILVTGQTVVTLEAAADPHSIFTGWSGDGCSGGGPCSLVIDRDMSVTATFVSKTSSAWASPGLDPAFHYSMGYLVHDGQTVANEAAHDAAVQSDGGIVVAGEIQANTNSLDAVLYRFNPEGAIDTTFGQNGRVIFAGPQLGKDVFHAAAIQTNGQIVAVGTTYNGTNQDLLVMRFEPNGAIDTAFGTGGITTFNGAGNQADAAHDLALLPDGRIVVVGVGNILGSIGRDDLVVLRYTSAGVLDTAFGQGGVVSYNGGNYSYDSGQAIALDWQCRILVAGYSGSYSDLDLVVLRYSPQGALDTAFASQGVFRHGERYQDDRGSGIAIQPNGRIVVAGMGYNPSTYDNDIRIIRLAMSGAVDATFATNGTLLVDGGTRGNDEAADVRVLSDGRIRVAGWADAGADDNAVVFGLTSDGRPDSSVGWNGMFAWDGPARRNDRASALALSSEGQVLVAGTTTVAPDRTEMLLIKMASDFPQTHLLTLNIQGASPEAVTTYPPGADCGDGCRRYPAGTTVLLVADAGSSARFIGWSGPIDGDNPAGWVTMDKDQTVTAVFMPAGDPIGDAIEMPGLTWSTGGPGRWTPIEIIAFEGNDSMEAASADHGTASLETSITGPAVVGFYWKVSSEPGCDFLSFYVDGDRKASISGEVQWRQRSYALAPGSHLLRWDYAKDGSGAKGSDRGWIDRLEVCAVQESISPTNAHTGYEGGVGSVEAVGANPCWLVTSDVPWIQVHSITPSQTGRAVAYQVEPGNPRTGTLTLGGLVFTVNQGDIVDPTFASPRGYRVQDAGLRQWDYGSGMVRQSDGCIVVAGELYDDQTDRDDALLVRYQPDGTLDQSFAQGGIVRYHGGAGAWDWLNSVALDPDGRILAAGATHNGANYDVLLLCYTAKGELDPAFGAVGAVAWNGPANRDDKAWMVSVRPDGRILVAGETHGGSSADLLVLQFTRDGSLDSSFGSDGTVFYNGPSNGNDWADALRVDDADRVLVAGGSSNGSNDDGLVLRLLPGGGLDPSFGLGGVVRFDGGTEANEKLWDVSIQTDGKIVAAGRGSATGASDDVLLLRLDPEGQPDPAFGQGGVIYFGNPGTGSDLAEDLLVQPDGKILVAGQWHNGANTDALLLRYLPDGTLDPDFGNQGVYTFDANVNGNDWFKECALLEDGRILALGGTVVGPDLDDILLVQLGTASPTEPMRILSFAPMLSTGAIRIEADPGSFRGALEQGVLAVQLEFSSDLATWTPSAIQPFWESNRIVVLETLPPQPWMFYRLKIVSK
ncbi:MAG TPA: right-handed parallel beta-helix repeat-containing protein [Candidatus Paceibacterota bacterium]|nr:right-handed parallel beta-helix repeat-containing protein [Verrucomicrobiota bacterium]HRZ44113.1 right-handed parallel beta-helix repeat-containing protein [Candidatus Paceibacterota bacterium]